MFVWKVRRGATFAHHSKQTARNLGKSNVEAVTADPPKATRDRRTLSTGTSRWVKVQGTHRMTWSEPPVSFSRQRNIHLPVWHMWNSQGRRRKTPICLFVILFSPGPPKTAGVWLEGRGAFVPGREKASGWPPPRDRWRGRGRFQRRRQRGGPTSSPNWQHVLKVGNTSSHMSRSLTDADCLHLPSPTTAAHRMSVNDVTPVLVLVLVSETWLCCDLEIRTGWNLSSVSIWCIDGDYVFLFHGCRLPMLDGDLSSEILLWSRTCYY